MFYFSFLFFSVMLQSAIYQHPVAKFVVEYDEAKWEVVAAPTDLKNDADKAWAQQTLLTIQRKVADDKYRARFSVVVEKLPPSDKPIEAQSIAYQKKAMEFLKAQRFINLKGEARTLSHLETTGFQLSADQRDFGLSVRQVGFVQGDKAYLLTAAARIKNFDTYLPEINRFFDSFSFKPLP